MGFRGYIVGRLLQMFPVILIIICLNFLIINAAPGDPVVAMIGPEAIYNQEWVDRIRIRFGLDRPVLERLWIYLSRVLQGDLSDSYVWSRPVSSVLAERLGNTLLLTLTAQVIAIPLGVLLGLYAAKYRFSKKDTALTVVGWVLYSTPTFWRALILMYTFAVFLAWFPVSGMITIGGEGGILDVLRHMVLPITSMVIWNVIFYFRISRASVIETLQEDFTTTARAKGLTENRVLFRHALRNALIPTVTVAGIMLGYIFTGAMVTETVFAWPGIGDLTLVSIRNRDYPMLMGIFLITSISVLVFSFITDILYAYLDPRIRYK